MNQTKKMKFSIQPETGCLSEQDAKRYFTVIGLAVFALMLLYHVGSMVLTNVIYALSPALLDYVLVLHALSLIPLYGIALPVFCLILRRLPKGIPSGAVLSGGALIGGFGISVAMMMAGNYVSQILIGFFERAMGSQQENPVEMMTVGVPWWINLIFVALIPCLLEELVFRKILCDRLLPLGEGYAVVISAVVFGLAHGNFFQLFYGFALGMIFATVYVKTGKIWITMLYHGTINLMGGVLAPLILSKIAPMMEETNLLLMEEYLSSQNNEALAELLEPYLLPMLGLLLYEGVMFGAMIVGLIYFFRSGKNLRFQSGLLPVPRNCRVSAVLLNAGSAAALTVFAAIFLLSLL